MDPPRGDCRLLRCSRRFALRPWAAARLLLVFLLLLLLLLRLRLRLLRLLRLLRAAGASLRRRRLLLVVGALLLLGQCQVQCLLQCSNIVSKELFGSLALCLFSNSKCSLALSF